MINSRSNMQQVIFFVICLMAHRSLSLCLVLFHRSVGAVQMTVDASCECPCGMSQSPPRSAILIQ